MRRLAAAAALPLILGACGGGASAAQDDEPADRSTNAWVMCEEFIKKRMGGDQDFGGRDATTVKGRGNGPYTVASTVNGDKYRCHIRSDKAGDEWTLVDLTVAR